MRPQECWNHRSTAHGKLDRIATTALNHGDVVHTRRKLENMLQGALELLDMHLPLRIALGQAVGTKRLVDAGIDRELIAIDLRANGVEMHVA